MRILWITNVMFPKLSRALGLKPPVVGGWTYSLANLICKLKDVDLYVICYSEVKSLIHLKIDDITYYVLPIPKKSRTTLSQVSIWENILMDTNPDCIHIHGTEYPRALDCIRASSNIPYIVSIQGLIGVYARYVDADIPLKIVLRNLTIRDLIKFDSPFFLKRRWRKGSNYENEYIKRAVVVLGRTEWDYVHTKAIFPDANYKVCNEMLRSEFYMATKWNLKDCRRHSIFVSQGNNPIKGLHKLVEAMAYLKQDYPDLMLRIGGISLDPKIKLTFSLRKTWYRLYLRSHIKKNDLLNNVFFIGLNDPSQMIHEYQSAHVSISCSSIENSSNSIGEAQLIGTPIIASYAGGSPEMVNHGKAGLLYRFEDVPTLVLRIRQIFESDDLAMKLSNEGIRMAGIRHDRQSILDNLMNIYREVI